MAEVSAVPQIETARLRLREFRGEDFARFAEIWATPEVVRFICPPRSEGDSWKSFLANAGSWALVGMGQWAVEDRQSGRVVGQTGFFQAKRGFGSAFDGVPECGWVLAPEAWGRGYGREAVEAAHRWFDAQAFGGASVALITVGHTASEVLATSMGYVQFATREDGGDRLGLYRRNG